MIGYTFLCVPGRGADWLGGWLGRGGPWWGEGWWGASRCVFFAGRVLCILCMRFVFVFSVYCCSSVAFICWAFVLAVVLLMCVERAQRSQFFLVSSYIVVVVPFSCFFLVFSFTAGSRYHHHCCEIGEVHNETYKHTNDRAWPPNVQHSVAAQQVHAGREQKGGGGGRCTKQRSLSNFRCLQGWLTEHAPCSLHHIPAE